MDHPPHELGVSCSIKTASGQKNCTKATGVLHHPIPSLTPRDPPPHPVLSHHTSYIKDI